MGAEEYWPDIEADAWRFYRWWLEIEDEVFPDVSSARLIEMLERLPLYDGALTARATVEANKTGANVGANQKPMYDDSGNEQIGSSAAEFMNHPATAGLFEYSRV
jgi:hypothetical protein